MNPERGMREHRWGVRVELNAPAELLTADLLQIAVVIRNASFSGAFIETNIRLPRLTLITIRPLAFGSFALEAAVARPDPAGLGIEWLDSTQAPMAELLGLSRPVTRRMPGRRSKIPLLPRTTVVAQDSAQA
jgi:hypothetical protein